MLIGKIIKSNSHTDYICQVYGHSEVEVTPTADDYAFGTFVRTAQEDDRWLVGIIYDTVLFNPEFGRLGPRLSPEAELSIFSPDYINEKALLVGIISVGMVDSSGDVIQGIPPLAVKSEALVHTMADEQVRAFHAGSPDPQLAYAPVLLAKDPLLMPHLLQTVLKKLVVLFPEHKTLLSVLESELSWKAQISPLGGSQ